jgi:hypothetical protein
VSNHETPRVMIVGTGKLKDTVIVNKILSDIEPELIPAKLLQDLYVTAQDDTKYRVDRRFLGKGIDYKNIYQCLASMGIQSDVKLVEIVIDLDAAQELLTAQAALILNTVFPEQ